MSALNIAHLTKRYGTTIALDDMSFEVHSGEIFGFVGSNGAGKTTTMRIALGVLAADSGTVTWDGRPIDAAIRRTIGYMPEERGLYPRMKVGDQLVYLARLHGLARSEAIAAMEQWTQRLGLEQRRGDEVLKLSLGNHQRVQLAAALVHHPKILVLDEPFSGLDPVGVDVMSTVLRERADAGVPVLFSSHQLDLVERLCDRVGIVRGGAMVASGTIEQLRTAEVPRWQAQVAIGALSAIDALAGIRVINPGESGTSDALDDAVPAADTSARGTIVFETERPGAEQLVLKTALDYGPVTAFGHLRPSLTDLFRHVVSEGSTP